MMSFLKSILWKKSKSPKASVSLSQEVQQQQKQIEKLQQEVDTLKLSMQEMTICVQNVTLVMHSLSQEVLTILVALKDSAYSSEPDMFTLGMSDEDDDNLLN